ncbi:unnamed protein product [Prorocentrum cordatum]|uniref:PDZ domain-containing protein n=1 Tax=Prorocentrum cordatum TaxID=2364126 RepID=A0ABN9YDA5_9DINO|nr:unnamed protein product [Polarella glacialis]
MSSDATAAPKGKRRPAEPVSVSEFTVTLPGVMSAEREDLRLGVHTKAVEGEGLRITCLKKSGRLIGWNRLQNTPPEQVQVGDMLVSVNGKRSLINVMVSVLEQPQGRGDNLQLVFQRPVYPERLKNILVIGGYDGLSYYGETELWDEDGHGFEDGPRLRVHRWGAAALPIPGHSLVLVAGGFDGSEHQATTEVLNTKCTNSAMQAEDHGFQMGPRMLAPRLGCSMVQLDARRVLVIGGYGLDSTEVLDLETMEFQPGPRLLAPRACCAAVVLEDGRLLVAGGFDRVGTTSSTEVLDLGAEGSLTDSAGFPRGGLELLRS